jgi:hypothetical protein
MTKLEQITFDFDKTEVQQQPRRLTTIQCYECKEFDELDGYRFRLVPLCRDCRTVSELEITANRFERRQNARR